MQAPLTTAPARRSRSSPESCSSVNISKNGISLDMLFPHLEHKTIRSARGAAPVFQLSRRRKRTRRRLRSSPDTSSPPAMPTAIRSTTIRSRRPTKAKTYFLFNWISPSFALKVFRSPPSACPPAGPGGPCKGSPPSGRAGPPPCRRRCRCPRRRPRRGR